MLPLRVVFCYSHEPSGHAQAARALESYGRMAYGWKTDRLNLSSDLHPLLGPIISKTYMELAQKSPALWDYLYDNRTVARAVQELRRLINPFHRFKFRAKIEALNPDILVCTHALPCATLSLEKEEGHLKAPLVAVPTDFSIHAYWLSQTHSIDLLLAPSEEARRHLIQQGVPSQSVKVTGIPIHHEFSQPLDKVVARTRLNLPRDKPILLICGGTRGVGPLQGILSCLLREVPEAYLLAVCGENAALYNALKGKYSRHPSVRISAFMQEMFPTLCAADLLIGKPGGVTSSEALALGLPQIIYAPLPGQEERNALYLTRETNTPRVRDMKELTGVVRRLLHHPQELSDLARRAGLRAHPASAKAAADAIHQLISARMIPDQFQLVG